jgi:putative transposase
MKTLEFKLTLTLAQQQIIDLWLDQLKWIWNESLSLLEEDQQRKWREKNPVESDVDAVAWHWHRNTDESYGLACECAVYNRKTETLHPVCKLRTKMDAVNPGKHFWKPATNEATPDKPWLHDICSRLRVGVTDSLLKAWKAYKDPTHPGRKPKYKGKRDKLRSLTNRNPDKGVRFSRIGNSDNAYVKIPKLGIVKVKGLYKRYKGLRNRQRYKVVRILKEPSGYYLQIVYEEVYPLIFLYIFHLWYRKTREYQSVGTEELNLWGFILAYYSKHGYVSIKSSDKVVGIDWGLKSVITTDSGKSVAPPRLYRQKQKQLRRLQRKAARQIKGSNSQKRTYKQIGKLHEKIRRSRNAFNHKLSTSLVREFGMTAIEDILRI